MQVRFSPTGLGLILTFVLIIGSVLSIVVMKGQGSSNSIMTRSADSAKDENAPAR